jgi:hypothetical protein
VVTDWGQDDPGLVVIRLVREKLRGLIFCLPGKKASKDLPPFEFTLKVTRYKNDRINMPTMIRERERANTPILLWLPTG